MHLIFVATVHLQSLICFSAGGFFYEPRSGVKGRICNFCDYFVLP